MPYTLPRWERGNCYRLDEGRRTDMNLSGDAFDEDDDHDGSPRVIQLAKAVCENCPLRAACLDWALVTKQDSGVWGGLTTAERFEVAAEMNRSRRRMMRIERKKLALEAAGIVVPAVTPKPVRLTLAMSA